MTGGSQVDPHPAMTADEACDEWWERGDGPCEAAGDAFSACVGFKAGWRAARSAVVRPTRPEREEIARCIVGALGRVNVAIDRDKGRAVADALLAEFWPGTPEAAKESDE